MRRGTVGIATAAMLLTLCASGVDAQDFAGSWNVELGDWRSEGAMAVQVQGLPQLARLSVTAAADSAIAVLETRYEDGQVRSDTLRGTISGSTLTVSGTRDHTSRSVGADAQLPPPSHGSSVMELELVHRGGAVEGWLRIGLPDAGAAALAAVTGGRGPG